MQPPFARRGLEGKRLLQYCLYAFGMPAVVAAVACILLFVAGTPSTSTSAASGVGECRKLVVTGFIWCSLGSVALLLVTNAIFFALTCRYLIQNTKDVALMIRNQKQTYTFWLYVKLFVLMGGTWLVGVVSYFTNTLEGDIVSLVLFGLQGVFIFLIFVCKKEVVEDAKRKAGEWLADRWSTGEV
ncbi:unnamed protein product [Darwinula stevensoni]|uniref:Uncharacterized protein n=1 Tax=Darwinula stevensoni TaxID=69355 RepID=A0A7R8X9A3_9CRUS|nr:unnamed protein product [Darwinula stevensoni]CAG0888821.1 unnamed protein product [Darwinula stevensoni]